MTPKWKSGTLYLPGALVQPLTAIASSPTAITNSGFESGDVSWDKPAGWTIISGAGAYQGDWIARFTGSGQAVLLNQTQHAVKAGQSITASGYVRIPGGGDNSGCRMVLVFYTSANVQLPIGSSSAVPGTGNAWKQMSVTNTAPATAAYVRVGISATNNIGTGPVDVDSSNWNYIPPVPAGLIYKAVQPAAGLSDSVEPVWPATLGVQVIDKDVIWEAVLANRVTWQASPIMVSGSIEPAWPTEVGAFIADNTISWETVSRRVEDKNCPNSKVVAIIASKVFAADKDIVRFSATANPKDWTTEKDAGYLPTGLQQANANDMAVLQPYRGNLAPMNANCFQNWQVDPDPTQMAILDQMDGVGSTHQQAAQSVGNELFYLSQRGVRTVGIANAAENLAAGDVGMPIDPLVRAAVGVAGGVRPLATYYPGAGQYWLAMRAPLPVLLGPSITGAAPDFTVGQAYTFTYTVTAGSAPVVKTVITSGALVAGLTWDETTATISGTPTVGGTMSLEFLTSDENGLTDTHSDVIGTLTEWLITYPSASTDTMKKSPNGDDWTGAGFQPGSWFPGNAEFARNGPLQILCVGTAPTAGLKSIVSNDAGATWAAADMPLLSSSGGSPVHLGGFWHVASGAFDGFYRSPSGGALTWTLSGTTADNFTDIGTIGQRLVAVAPNKAVAVSDDYGVTWPPAAALPDPGSVTTEGMYEGAGVLGLVGRTPVAANVWDCAIKSTTDGNTWASHPNPFASVTTTTTSRTCIQYDAGLGLWLVSYYDRIAYGATLGALTLSPYVFPGIIMGIGSDGKKVLAVGVGGMIEKTTNGAGWTALASGLTVDILDVVALK